MESFKRNGNIVDIRTERFFYGEVVIDEGRIISVTKIDDEVRAEAPFILPGFIDSHVHIESSMLVPSEFAKLAVVHGTVATVSDPHEIANVCGMKGVQFMIDNGKSVPFKFHFGAPSCVPATTFETAGAFLDADDVEELLRNDDIKYLSEMMNFPGVLNEDADVMKKIASAKKYNKPVDGHAPGLTGVTAKQYIDAGISTDHECFTIEEALSKLEYGMKILIREGSAAKNFEALVPLLHDHCKNIMFCSDDKHPDSLVESHINSLCSRAVKKGINIFNILRAACVNPVMHYKLDVGLLQPGDPADFIIVKDLKEFHVNETFINGKLVAANGNSLIETTEADVLNHFDCEPVNPSDFTMKMRDEPIPVIEAIDGQLITNKLMFKLPAKDGLMMCDLVNDILKIVVVNRYTNSTPAVSFIKNFGLKTGALASSVAHDSHNIVAVGVDDESLAQAINLIISQSGGISAVSVSDEMLLPLPVAGLMSTENGYKVAASYTAIDKFAKEQLGSTLNSPFMTLSFMALLVIPHLKLSDKGLFDGDTFSLIKT